MNASEKLPTDRGNILLVEDDEMLSGLLARVLRGEGYTVEAIDRVDALPSPARLAKFDLVLSDIHLAEGSTGHEILKRVKRGSAVPVILMTAYADVEGAMTAVVQGAYDYLAKPIDPSELKSKVNEAITRRRFALAPPSASNLREDIALAEIVGTAPAMINVYKTVAQVAPTTATVLIIGESGTGKELVSKAIHAKSPRANRPFVGVNCAALPESILESELFGHERGAFTGATGVKRGLFEEANGGTLLLDEIGEISPKMQVQLLRVLQEGEIRRVGGVETIKVDVRVVAATNRDLRAEVTAGRFREDLYFRLQVVTLRMPALRERRGDIPLLVRHLMARQAERLGRPIPRIAPDAVEALAAHDFPGNVRELGHVIERAIVLAREGVITLNDLPPEISKVGAAPASTSTESLPLPLGDDWPTLATLERRYIDRVLARTAGNKTRAADILGIDRRTLNRMFARERGVSVSDLSDIDLDDGGSIPPDAEE